MSLFRPHDCVAAGLDAGGEWSLRFEAHEGLEFNAVLKGNCLIAVDGENPIELQAGDCMILPHGRSFLLSSKPSRMGRDARAIYRPVSHGGTAVLGKGSGFYMSGARFLLSGPAADILLGCFPPLIVVRPGQQQELVAWALDKIADELRLPRPGSTLSITHLSHFLLVQVMRIHLDTAAPQMTG